MNSVAFRPLLAASGQDKDLSYEIEWSLFPAGAPEMEALNAGAIDYGQVGDIPFLTAYAAGSPGRVTGLVTYRPKQLELLVQGDSGITSVADLKGKKIAVNRGGGGHIYALILLDQAGIPVEDVELVYLGPVDAKPAFATRAIDAWVAWPAYSTLAIEQDGGRSIADLSSLNGVNVAVDYVFAHKDAIENKREIVADFHRRIARARLWSLQNVDETSRIISRHTKLPVDLARRIRIEIEPTPGDITDQAVSDLQVAADIFRRHNVIGPVDVSGAFDRSFALGS